jgi:hypothetical protein
MFEELLKTLGVDSKSIAAVKKAVEDKDDKFDLKPIAEAFHASQRKLYENDDEIVNAIHSKEKGKLYDIVTKKIKTKFGLDSAAIKDKNIDEVIDMANEHSKKGMDTTIKEEQEKNVQLTAKLKEFEEVTIPKIKGEAEIEKKRFKIGNKVRTFFKEEDLRVPLSTVEKTLQRDLYEAFDLDIDDNENVQIFTKDKRLAPKSKDGTKLLTAQEVIDQILKENQFIKESNADDVDDKGNPKKKEINPTRPKPSGGDDPNIKKKLPHLEKALEHQEALKVKADPPKK